MEKEKRNVSKMKYVAAFALACLVFIGGLYAGYMISESKVNDILSVEREARLQLENLELEERLLDATPCMSPSLLSENLDELGAKLSYLETNYDKNDPKILELKKPYTLLEVRHYLTMKRMVERCDSKNYTLILFFYSNAPEFIAESEKQGFVLNYLQKKFTTDSVKVYSFDSDLDVEIIGALKEVYGVETVPSIVMDGKLYAGFHDKDELESIIESKR